MSRHDEAISSDAKTRRKQQEARRMRYRRAIEHYTDQCRLQAELSDYPDLVGWAPADQPKGLHA